MVAREDVFRNDARLRIYDEVAHHPGATVQEVALAVGLSHPTVRYHLDVLSRSGLVTFLDKGNKLLFFRNRGDFNDGEREVVAILRNAEAMKVYASIEQSPWVMRAELSEALGVSRASVNWHLRSLMDAGLVDEVREQGRAFLFVRREGREVLARVSSRLAQAGLAPSLGPTPA